MRILVTGGNGYIGSCIASGFAARGHEVYATWRTNRERLLALSDGIEIKQLDLLDTKAVNDFVKAVRPEVTIHTAAFVTSENSARITPALIASNVVATGNLAAAACAAECQRFVFTSSASVYGARNAPSGGFTENDVNPDTVYGWSKHASEEILDRIAAVEKGFSPISLRLAGVHGGARTSGALYAFSSAALSHTPIRVVDAESRFRWAFIEDVFQGIEKALTLPAAGQHCVFNLASRDIFTLLQVAEKIVEINGSKSTIMTLGNAPIRDSNMNIDYATSDLGFLASSLETRLRNYINELRRR
jgi:nucleoside-diphosphate-sugar epimerase